MEKIKLSKTKYKKFASTMATIKSTIEAAKIDIEEKEADNRNLVAQKYETDKFADRQSKLLSAEFQSRILNNNTAIENNKALIEILEKKYDLLVETVDTANDDNE